MLLQSILITYLLKSVYSSEVQVAKPYIFPIPFELPTRNERADQCWLRIEDVELVETLTIYCTLAQGFLRNFIRDYNSRKMVDDGVDVSLWSEEPRPDEDDTPKPADGTTGGGQKIKDWKTTTVMDPITHRRLYVTTAADCHLIMYSREGITNYKVNCENILFFVNHHMSGSPASSYTNCGLLVTCVMVLCIYYRCLNT